MSNYRRSIFVILLILTTILLYRSITSSQPSIPKSDGASKPRHPHARPEITSADRLRPASQRTLNADQPSPFDVSSRPLRQQLSYYFPYGDMDKFPAYIWQTWKVPSYDPAFPKQWRDCEASWDELHPGFIHQVITDEAAVHMIRHLFSGLPDVIEAYLSLPRPVLKADFFRYLILLARGGIYTDVDTTALKPAVDWVPSQLPRSSYGLVIGIEADPDRPDWADWYSRRVQFCQWTIQAKPGHPVLREIVAKITEDTLERKRAGTLEGTVLNDVIEFTGPAAWTDIIFKFFNDPTYFDMSHSKGNISWHNFTGITQAKRVGDVVVLPITSFSPGIETMGSKGYEDPMAFVKHAFDGTWKPEDERHVGLLIDEEGHMIDPKTNKQVN